MSKYAIKKNDNQFKLSEEVATEQVVDLLTYYDIDVEALTSNRGDDKAAVMLENCLDQISLHVRRGTLQVERDQHGKMTVIHNLISGKDEQVIYREVNSKAKLAMEKFDPNAGYSRIYAFMGSLSGLGKAGIEKMGPQDLAVVEVLGTVFLNA